LNSIQELSFQSAAVPLEESAVVLPQQISRRESGLGMTMVKNAFTKTAPSAAISIPDQVEECAMESCVGGKFWVEGGSHDLSFANGYGIVALGCDYFDSGPQA